MRTECIIGVKLERYDRDRYVKPFFYNLPYSSRIVEWSFDYQGISELVLDSKCFGIMFDLFYAISKTNETNLKLKVIITNEEEEHEDWIKLERVYENYAIYKVHNLNNYNGESHGSKEGPAIDLSKLYNISNPRYIYLKKI